MKNLWVSKEDLIDLWKSQDFNKFQVKGVEVLGLRICKDQDALVIGSESSTITHFDKSFNVEFELPSTDLYTQKLEARNR